MLRRVLGRIASCPSPGRPRARATASIARQDQERERAALAAHLHQVLERLAIPIDVDPGAVQAEDREGHLGVVGARLRVGRRGGADGSTGDAMCHVVTGRSSTRATATRSRPATTNTRGSVPAPRPPRTPRVPSSPLCRPRGRSRRSADDPRAPGRRARCPRRRRGDAPWDRASHRTLPRRTQRVPARCRRPDPPRTPVRPGRTPPSSTTDPCRRSSRR